MVRDILTSLYERGLSKLKDEILLYKDERNLWKTIPGTANSGGNLCLHLIGNLNHYIGSELGHSGYMRKRELEFSLKDIPAASLAEMVTDTSNTITQTLSHLRDYEFDRIYDQQVFPEEMTTAHFLVHLLTHLHYHLGQINYHRRMVENG